MCTYVLLQISSSLNKKKIGKLTKTYIFNLLSLQYYVEMCIIIYGRYIVT